MSGIAERALPRGAAGAPPVTERVVRHVGRLLQRGELKPGDRLPTERDLAREVAVSRHSVRVALQLLTAIGIVRSRQGAGTFIQEGPPRLGGELLRLLAALHGFTREEMLEARGVLEVDVAGLSAQRATGEQVAAISDEVAAMFASLADPAEFLVHDMRFHHSIAAGSNSPVLAALVSMVSALVYERRRTSFDGSGDLRESAERHRRIYQAIRRDDVAEARRAMAEHLQLAPVTEGDAAAPPRRAQGRKR